MKASLPGAGAAPDGLPATSSPDRLTVLVFDYAGIPAKVRSRAEQEAAYILGRSGPEAHFVDCLTGPEASGNPAACRPPFDPAALYVRIVAQRPARGLPAETLGFAALETGSGGQYAGIFYRSAADAASRLQADVYLMLGCVLAHEIGHMLLGPRSHSPDGIMRARWTREDLLRAGQRSLRFTPEQSARVRSAVEARNNPHPPPTDSALSLAQSDRPTRGPEKIPLLRFDQHPFNPLCSDSAATSLQRSLMGRPVNAYAPTADSVLCAAY
ncbi:MAG TPA: hypothetical protein VI455_05470 [Terriglobia bacterium]